MAIRGAKIAVSLKAVTMSFITKLKISYFIFWLGKVRLN